MGMLYNPVTVNKIEPVHPEDLNFFYPEKKHLAEKVWAFCRDDLGLPADCEIGFFIRADEPFASRLRWHMNFIATAPRTNPDGLLGKVVRGKAYINIYTSLEEIPFVVAHEARHVWQILTGAPTSEDDADQYAEKVARVFGQTRSVPSAVEQRSLGEVRADATGRKIRGYAALFNELSEPLGGFRERILPGAFTNTLKNDDIRLLVDHNPSMVLARTKNGTLKLKEDSKGLWFEAELPDTTVGRDVYTSIKRGDIDQMSFGFKVVKDRWLSGTYPQIRELLEVKLFDVSVVTFPAYPQTTVEAASALSRRGFNLDLNELKAALYRRQINHRATRERDYATIRRAITVLERLRTTMA
ncbi:MAG: HK97 family phage prohead protease [Bacillota bacterium]